MFGLDDDRDKEPEEEKCPGESKCPDFNLAHSESGNGLDACGTPENPCPLLATKPGIKIEKSEKAEEEEKPLTRNEYLIGRVRRLRQQRISYGKPLDDAKMTYIEAELVLVYDYFIERAERQAEYITRTSLEETSMIMTAIISSIKG